ncbi:AraC family transcriptional regulator [Arenicella sp. 4NH20-0111]|uniref:AraC family transcriptional regulator n=1 Tax=Arenicella sp. 4NH20-0111 TaxID=3127648 RepID=UPI003101D855
MSNEYRRNLPESSDLLGQALYQLRMNGSLYCQSELYAPWGLKMPEMPGEMMFHIVMSGECWLSVDSQAGTHLPAGSLALVPKGQGHSISSGEGIECTSLFDIPIIKVSERYEFMRHGGDGDHTSLLCGVINFDQVSGAKLIAQLPDVLAVDSVGGNQSAWLQSTLRLITSEAANMSLGGETIMAHLADIIVIHAIRHWVETSIDAQHGWLGALKDPKLGKALVAIHNQPEKSWTVDQLAQAAGMSRSGFSARFTEIIGTSVKQYLTHWRMTLARSKLMTQKMPLGDLAEELGYQSEAAFSRAYKRVMGESPIRQIK